MQKSDVENKTICPICGSQGEIEHKSVRDLLFKVKGEWDIILCNSKECQIYWVNPRPKDFELSELYNGYYTHNDKKSYGIKNQFLNIFNKIKKFYVVRKFGYLNGGDSYLKKICFQVITFWGALCAYFNASVFYLGAKPGGRLLDIGCGNGDSIKFMSSLGWNVEGIEYDNKAAENARSKGLTVHIGDLLNIKLDGNFDAIVMRHVIEHVPDPRSLISECFRLLKPGGLFVVLTPNSKSMGHRIYKSNWRGLEPPRHLQIFNKDNLAKLISESGFNVEISSTTSNGAAFIYRGSHQIITKSRMKNVTKISIIHWIAFFLMQEINNILLKFNKNIGEEIYVLSRK
jgi:2-polyprenyl-3-methyl-5-hydroxy-6-metoxy-1,4-benzoquinol methylase